MRLVAEAEQLVVVGEVHVPVEGERAQVGEVVEAVALQPRAELQLQRDTNREEDGEDDVEAGFGRAGGPSKRRNDATAPTATPTTIQAERSRPSVARIDVRATSRAQSSSAATAISVQPA